jgi:Bacterial Ig domain
MRPSLWLFRGRCRVRYTSSHSAPAQLRSFPRLELLEDRIVLSGVVAHDDSYSLTENGELNVTAASGVLANDVASANSHLVSYLYNNFSHDGRGASHGSVTLNPDGSFLYTPDANYAGTDSFTYTAFDNQAGVVSGPATVHLTVYPSIKAVAHDDSYYLTVNGLLNVPAASGVLANDFNPYGGSPDLKENVSHGSLTLNPDGSFLYTPNPNYTGTDSFTYIIASGSETTSTATVHLTVLPPVGVVAHDDSYSLTENTALNVPANLGVLANDYDFNSEGHPNLFAHLLQYVSHGGLLLNPDGSFFYIPDDNYTGTDSFTYQAIDGDLASTATVYLTINPPTQVLANGDFYFFARNYLDTNGSLNVPASSGVLANDSGPNHSHLVSYLVEGRGVSHGSLTLNPDGSFLYSPGNYSGDDAFTYTVFDPQNPSAGSSQATVVLRDDFTYPPLRANDDSYSLAENGSLNVPAASGVLANDFDPYGGSPSSFLREDVSHGSMTLNPDGSFLYTPNPNYVGTDSFTYVEYTNEVNSFPATVYLTVTPPLPASDRASSTMEGARIDPISSPVTPASGDSTLAAFAGAPTTPPHGPPSTAPSAIAPTPLDSRLQAVFGITPFVVTAPISMTTGPAPIGQGADTALPALGYANLLPQVEIGSRFGSSPYSVGDGPFGGRVDNPKKPGVIFAADGVEDFTLPPHMINPAKKALQAAALFALEDDGVLLFQSIAQGSLTSPVGPIRPASNFAAGTGDPEEEEEVSADMPQQPPAAHWLVSLLSLLQVTAGGGVRRLRKSAGRPQSLPPHQEEP